MVTELRTFKFTCDGCRAETVVYNQDHQPAAPHGWRTVSVGPCGLTNYYRDELRCPECYEKEQANAD